AIAVPVVLYSPASLALHGGLGSSRDDNRGKLLFNLFTGCCTSFAADHPQGSQPKRQHQCISGTAC
ncbi:hypothetical protein AB4Y42_43530, partial [Paraburkholderia sp. EG286B]|uniref:hypothetical protein n=1 Tax=Paraburkholderia sp. EG286B TaxID=3237011 RepID=UPI0034D187E6